MDNIEKTPTHLLFTGPAVTDLATEFNLPILVNQTHGTCTGIELNDERREEIEKRFIILNALLEDEPDF